MAEEGVGAISEEAISALEDIGTALTGWQEGLFKQSVWYTLFLALFVGVIAYASIKLLRRLLLRRNPGTMHFFFRLISAVIVTVAVLVVMMTITPLANLSRTLLAGSGLIAVVIGIAAQASLGNVFSGISIGISRPFVVGETIEVIGQDIQGTVIEMSLRQTVIRDLSNKRVVVPNSVLDKEIIRTVEQGDRAVINYLRVGIGYQSDLDGAIQIIKRAVMAHKDFFDTRTKQDRENGAAKDVVVAVTDLAESAVQLRASVWSKDAGTGFLMLSDLRQTILREFRQAGIEIPYAYRNVILHSEETGAQA